MRLCWSFGNDGETYIYGREIEPIKREIHLLVTGKTVHERRLAWAHLAQILKRSGGEILEADRMQHLQGLERLEGVDLNRVIASGKDYRAVELPEDCVVYCDIPYGNCRKDNYGAAFDHAAFYDWAAKQTAPVVISEYDCPDARFALLDSCTKVQLSGGGRRRKRS